MPFFLIPLSHVKKGRIQTIFSWFNSTFNKTKTMTCIHLKYVNGVYENYKCYLID